MSERNKVERVSRRQFLAKSAAGAGAAAALTTGEATATATEDSAASLRAELQLPPGFSTDAPTETVATAGIQGQSNDAVLFGGRGGRGEFGEGGADSTAGEALALSDVPSQIRLERVRVRGEQVSPQQIKL